MQTIPDNVEQYAQTPSFTADTVPPGLLKDHSTKSGVWGLLVIERGEVLYTVTDPEDPGRYELCKGQQAVIVPTQRHYVSLLSDDAVFHVKFLK